MKFLAGLLLLTFFAETAALAQPTPVTESESPLQKLLSGLKYQRGQIVLGEKLATLQVPPEFSYLGPDDAAMVLTEIWGNPPSEKPLGMLLPEGLSPAQKECWAVIITYDKSGFVKDDDAAKIDYTKLLKEMQEGTEKASKERVKEGYPSIELKGWAAPPRYDASAKKLYWAKDLKFDGGAEHVLNYDIRALGRRGVLSLNCVADVSQLAEIEKAVPRILAMVDFNEGHRYADFDSKTDKVAEYGLAALVAGGIAAKAGFFKVLLAGILAAKKFIFIGVIALWGFIKKLLGKKGK